MEDIHLFADERKVYCRKLYIGMTATKTRSVKENNPLRTIFFLRKRAASIRDVLKCQLQNNLVIFHVNRKQP